MLKTRPGLPALAVIASLALASISLAQFPEIHYLQFNEGAGTTTADLASPGLPGSAPTLNGAATWNTTNPILGGAALTSATGGSDSVRTNTPLTVSGDWTIEMYLYDLELTSNTGLGYFMGDSTAGSFRAFRGGVAGVGNVILRGPLTDVTIIGADVQNTWVHIAWVYDSVAGQITPYLNGTPQTPVPQAPITLNGTDPLGLSVGGYSTSAGLNGYVDEFRFWNRVRTTTEIQAFLNSEIMAVPNDLGVTTVVSPTNPPGVCQSLTSTETVTAQLINLGTNQILAGTSIGMSYTADGGMNVVNETLMLGTTLNQFDTTMFSFAAPLDLSLPGTYTIDVTATLPGDQNASNDTRSTTVNSGGGAAAVNTFPYTEDFDGYGATNGGTAPPPGWIQDQADATGSNSDWFFRNTPTTSANTGPPADQTTGVAGVGFYAHVEDTGNFAAVNLESPCIDLVTNADPRLSYYIHSNDANGGGNENFLHVDVITYPGAVVMTDVAPPIGHLGDMWVQQVVDLTPFNGQTIQIRFRGTSDGGSTTHDIAIDTVQVVDVSNQGNGQPPVPGLSVMDINGARETVGFPVSAGLPGPYFATAQAGGTVDFHFEGEPSQPIVLLFGPLNPGAFLLLPLAGQLDIGVFDPMQGLTQVFLAGTGTGNGFFDLLLNTLPNGTADFSFQVPVNATGFHQAFQALIFAAAPVVISPTNAVDLMIN